MASKDQKESKSGFVTYLSPTKPCNEGKGTQFDVVLQDGEKSSTRIKGFGKQTYQNVKSVHEAKSPVRIELFKNPKFPKNPFTINERCIISPAKFAEVPFQYSSDAGSADSAGSEVTSKNATIKQIMEKRDMITPYTVTGIIQIGSAPVKVIEDGNKKLKGDVMVIDSTGKTFITLWDGQWKDLASDDELSITHVKFRDYGRDHLTTTFKSKITKEKKGTVKVKIPKDFTMEEIDAITIEVDVGNAEVGVVNPFSSCKICCTVVDECNIRTTSFVCKVCNRTHTGDKLIRTYNIPLFLKIDSAEKKLCIDESVLKKDLDVQQESDAGSALIDLLSERGKITYNSTSNAVVKIVPAEAAQVKAE